MNYPSHVRIVEVSPRDGLQNESQIIDAVSYTHLTLPPNR